MFQAFDRYRVETWRKLNPALELDAPHLRALLQLWQDKCRDGRLPGRADFETETLLGFGGRVMLIDVEHAPLRFRYRLIGSAMTSAANRDVTGRYLDDVYPAETYEVAVAGFLYCVEHRQPMAARGRLVHADKDHVSYESIDLPLARDGETVDMIMKGVDFPPPRSG